MTHEDYDHRPPGSTAQLRQAIPPERIAAVKAFQQRCATYLHLEGRQPFAEQNLIALKARVGPLTPTARAVYAWVRQAVRLGFDGAWISYAELGDLVGAHERSIGRAIAELLHLRLLTRMPDYVPTTVDETIRRFETRAASDGYTQRRDRNAYALGPAAKQPQRAGAVSPPDGGESRAANPEDKSDKIDDKTADKLPLLQIWEQGAASCGSPASGFSLSHTDPVTVRRRAELPAMARNPEPGNQRAVPASPVPERSSAAPRREAGRGGGASSGPGLRATVGERLAWAQRTLGLLDAGAEAR